MPDSRPRPIAELPAGESLALLAQAEDLVAGLDVASFTATCELLPGGTVGAHVRHVIDFYELFLRGVAAGRIDYDERDRDAELESSPAAARAAIRSVSERLAALTGEDLGREVAVRGDTSRAEGGWTRSTLGRELCYLRSHAIHHHALIGAILRSVGIVPAAGFGVAPSTLRHWRRGASASG